MDFAWNQVRSMLDIFSSENLSCVSRFHKEDFLNDRLHQELRETSQELHFIQLNLHHCFIYMWASEAIPSKDAGAEIPLLQRQMAGDWNYIRCACGSWPICECDEEYISQDHRIDIAEWTIEHLTFIAERSSSKPNKIEVECI
jgi:hypothetical protein